MNNQVTFTVAADGEYQRVGEHYTGIEDINIAKQLYCEVCAGKYAKWGPAIGIRYKTQKETYEINIVSNEVLHIDIMDYMPEEFREAEPVKKALDEIREAFPDYIDLSKEADYDELEL